MKVDIFIPCFIDQFFPETGWNMVKVLRRLGCVVNYNPSQTCCGQPALNAGYAGEAKSVAGKFIKDFEGNNPIVCPSSSCVGMIRKNYDEFFHNTSMHIQSKGLRKRMFEFSEFLGQYFPDSGSKFTFNGKVTYFDSCSALRQLGVKDQPREILKNVKGLELIEMASIGECCGFGGTFSMNFPEIAQVRGTEKLDQALKTGAENIVSGDLSCLMHLQKQASEKDYPFKLLHIADVLASGL